MPDGTAAESISFVSPFASAIVTGAADFNVSPSYIATTAKAFTALLLTVFNSAYIFVPSVCRFDNVASTPSP